MNQPSSIPSQASASGSGNNNNSSGGVEQMQVDTEQNTNAAGRGVTVSSIGIGDPSTSGGGGCGHNISVPTTEDIAGFRNILQRFTSVMNNQLSHAPTLVTTIQDINECNDVESLKEKCRTLFHKQEFLQFQLEISEFQNKLDHLNCVKEQDRRHAQAFELQKEEIFQQIYRILEDEFRCSVCSDIFIDPCVIECGHTFCKFCITEWKRQRRVCPVCRQYTGLAEGAKHVQIENLVDKLHTLLPQDIQEKREETKRERDEQTQAAGTQLRPGRVIGDILSFTSELNAMRDRLRQVFDRRPVLGGRGITITTERGVPAELGSPDVVGIEEAPPIPPYTRLRQRRPAVRFLHEPLSREENNSEAQPQQRAPNFSEASTSRNSGTSTAARADSRNGTNSTLCSQTSDAQGISEASRRGNNITEIDRDLVQIVGESIRPTPSMRRFMASVPREDIVDHPSNTDSNTRTTTTTTTTTTTDRGEPPEDDDEFFLTARTAIANQRSLLNRMIERNQRLFQQNSGLEQVVEAIAVPVSEMEDVSPYNGEGRANPAENSDDIVQIEIDVPSGPTNTWSRSALRRFGLSSMHRRNPPARVAQMPNLIETARGNMNSSNTSEASNDVEGNPPNQSTSAGATATQSEQSTEVRTEAESSRRDRRNRSIRPRSHRRRSTRSQSRSAIHGHSHRHRGSSSSQSARSNAARLIIQTSRRDLDTVLADVTAQSEMLRAIEPVIFGNEAEMDAAAIRVIQRENIGHSTATAETDMPGGSGIREFFIPLSSTPIVRQHQQRTTNPIEQPSIAPSASIQSTSGGDNGSNQMDTSLTESNELPILLHHMDDRRVQIVCAVVTNRSSQEGSTIEECGWLDHPRMRRNRHPTFLCLNPQTHRTKVRRGSPPGRALVMEHSLSHNWEPGQVQYFPFPETNGQGEDV